MRFLSHWKTIKVYQLVEPRVGGESENPRFFMGVDERESAVKTQQFPANVETNDGIFWSMIHNE